MKLSQLVEDAKKELEEEKISLAKEFIKARIQEIEKAEKILSRFKTRYATYLDKDVSEITDELDDEHLYL